jgi:hypothetical protein
MSPLARAIAGRPFRSLVLGLGRLAGRRDDTGISGLLLLRRLAAGAVAAASRGAPARKSAASRAAEPAPISRCRRGAGDPRASAAVHRPVQFGKPSHEGGALAQQRQRDFCRRLIGLLHGLSVALKLRRGDPLLEALGEE